MSKYEKDRKFFWLQLKEDFFDEDSMSWIEEQENGEKYSLFYLKLCLKSLKTNGVLIRKVGKMLIPYDKNTLATLTKTDVDTVVVSMELFKKIGLVQILENGEIFLTQIQNLIGAKSIGAFRKEQQRLLGGQKEDSGVDNCPPEIELELDIEIELELEKMDLVVDFYNNNIGLISPLEFQTYEQYIKDGFKVDLIIHAMELAVKQNKRNTAYVEGILKNWEKANIKNLAQIAKENEDFEKSKVRKEAIQYEEIEFESEEEYQNKLLMTGGENEG